MTKRLSKKTKPAKRNPTDITLRNLRAMKKTVALLAADVAALDANQILLYEGITDLNRCMAINVESLNTRLIKLETKRAKR